MGCSCLLTKNGNGQRNPEKARMYGLFGGWRGGRLCSPSLADAQADRGCPSLPAETGAMRAGETGESGGGEMAGGSPVTVG
jgi:hypothetical protein